MQEDTAEKLIEKEQIQCWQKLFQNVSSQHYMSYMKTKFNTQTNSASDHLATAANKDISTISSRYLCSLESCQLGVELVEADVTQTVKQTPVGSLRQKVVFVWGYTYVKCYYMVNINSFWELTSYKPVTEEVALIPSLIYSC